MECKFIFENVKIEKKIKKQWKRWKILEYSRQLPFRHLEAGGIIVAAVSQKTLLKKERKKKKCFKISALRTHSPLLLTNAFTIHEKNTCSYSLFSLYFFVVIP